MDPSSLRGYSRADNAASEDVMHHLSVTTDLIILVCLELMDLTWEKRSSGLKAYWQLRTNDSSHDRSTVKNNLLSLYPSYSLFQGHRGHWFTIKGQIIQGCKSLKFKVIATWLCLCAFLSLTTAIKTDLNSWATCEFESAAELWSIASVQDSELELHLCTNVFKQSRRWARISLRWVR